MVDWLVDLGIDILFVIGGDGSMRGAAGIADVAAVARSRRSASIGIPKTIDNDIPFIGQSFGFQTAFTTAAQVDPGRDGRGAVGDQRRRPGAS